MDQHTFVLPDLGEGLTEAEILAWRVGEGDDVAADDVVVEVETAKAAVEVPAPYAGRVLELHAQVGDVVAVGQPLLTVGSPTGPDNESSSLRATYRQPDGDSGAVLVGYGTGHAPARRRPATSRRMAPRVISPVVRKLARDRGLDVAALTGSGPSGVVLRRDVEAAASPAEPRADEVRIPLRGVQRAMAEKLVRSRREIPDVTTWVDVDATGMLDARDALRAAHPDRPVGMLALLARFVVAGLRRYPELNSRIDGEQIVQVREVHLGIAAQTARGLVVPVVKAADRLTTLELADAIARLTDLARDGRLQPAELTGGTFTLNNYGVFGVDGSTPIINHPEAALLGIGRIVDKPWVVDNALAVRKITQLSLTFDHRVCDGATAAGFLRYVADSVQRPLALLADV
ncbi:MAG: 2-oxo acid dehydrogenase subunit E2 [Jiangellaceae bacterium]|nr:2-oxo acid dehydrogenase subunit E2 [Jiangellaceae bacterium]